MDFAVGEFAIGIDLGVDPHGGCGEVEDVHALAVIDGDHGLAEEEGIAEGEGVDGHSGAAFDDLGVDLRGLSAGEGEDAEFAGLAGAAGDADFLGPVGPAGVEVEEDAVGGGSFDGLVGEADDGGDGEVSGVCELEDAGEVDLAAHGLSGFDDDGSEDGAADGGDGFAVAAFDDEVEPLAAGVAAEGDVAAGMVGDGDVGHDGFTGDVLGFGETEVCHQLRLGRDRDCDEGEQDF